MQKSGRARPIAAADDRKNLAFCGGDMTIIPHYETLLSRGGGALQALAGDSELLSKFTRVHNFSADFEVLLDALDGRSESRLLQLSIREYQYALHAAAIASYRHAHISLRLAFELGLAAIYFSAYEIKLRQWILGKGDGDIKWSVIVDPDNGIFSANFVNVFGPDLRGCGGQYAAIAGAVYRECSEYVHGNVHTHLSDSAYEFCPDLISAWIERAESFRLVLIFAFAVRYLFGLAVGAKNQVEHVLIEAIGHVEAVREFYAQES